jgi:hypothetical protein
MINTLLQQYQNHLHHLFRYYMHRHLHLYLRLHYRPDQDLVLRRQCLRPVRHLIHLMNNHLEVYVAVHEILMRRRHHLCHRLLHD